MAEPLDLSIVIVNWNVRDFLRECLLSLRGGLHLGAERYEVIVVDNASEDGSVEMLRAEFPNVQLIASDCNLGFVLGCQRGYDVSRGRLVLLLNPDTIVCENAIDAMLAEMWERPEAGIIGSRLVNTDGSFQRGGGGALASLSNVAWNFLFFNRVMPARLSPSPLFLTGDPQGIFEIGWVSGAAMLLRREAVGEQLFDPAIFMFGEDMDLCARVARDGWKVLYSAEHTIVHHHGRSIERQSSPEVLASLHKGPRTFFCKTHGALAVLCYDLVFLAGYLVRWLAFGLLARVRRGRDDRASARFSRQYLGIVWRMIWARSGAVPAGPRRAADGPAPVMAIPAAAPAAGHAPRFTVIINVYNGEEYLQESIKSVLAQSFGDWELILWDDGSTDRSGDICREYCNARIHYFRAEHNAGIGAARSAAVRRAAGEWIAFLDQDDIWLPHKLALQHALIERERGGELGLVYGRTTVFDRAGRTAPFDRWHGPGRLPEGDIFTRLLRKPSFIALSSVAIRRDALVELGDVPGDVVYCPDYYLCVAVARRYRTACVQEPCCLYRIHPESMSHVYRKQIIEEALRIIEKFAGPAQRRVLRNRRWAHNTLIGIDEMHLYATRWQGVRRILSRGSLLYLVLRPPALGLRRVRHRIIRLGGKYFLLRLIRSLGLLEPVDRVRFLLERLLHYRGNARFVRQYPAFAVPPADLAYDAYNHVDWSSYLEAGRRHAESYAALIRENFGNRPLAVLEWGCGPGRIIRHLRLALADYPVTLTGSDCNQRSIAWCRCNLPGIEFIANNALPPLDLPGEQFDVIYNFSVFPHLSAESQLAWSRELERLLKPGGLLICSTHGDSCRHLLTRREENARYDKGEVVVQAGYVEGRKWFLAAHPPRFVREDLLGAFAEVRMVAPHSLSGTSQDLWVARKAGPASPVLEPAGS